MSGNNRPGTPRGSSTKPNAGRWPTCHLAVARRTMLLFDSHNTIPFPRCSHAVTLPRPCHEPAMKGIFVAWQGNGMVCVNQTRPHCVNQMGKTQSKSLEERHGRGTAWYV
jgi:hypothetical protein